MAINTNGLNERQRGFLLVYLQASAELRRGGLDAGTAARRAGEIAEREYPLDPVDAAELSRAVQAHNASALASPTAQPPVDEAWAMHGDAVTEMNGDG